MAYELIAFDMDGTLLDSSKKIRQDSLDAIHEAVCRGKTVAISTGRQINEVALFNDYFYDIDYIICMSGAMIYETKTGKEIFSQAIPEEITKRLFDLTKDFDVMIHVLAYTSAAQKDRQSHMADYHMGQYQSMFDKLCVLPDDLIAYYNASPYPVHKFNFYCRSKEQRSEIEALVKALPVQLSYAEDTSLECSPPGVSKGSGLEYLCAHLGIGIEQAIAVGDAENDLDIMRRAGLGVAMANSKPPVFAVADAVVKSCDDGGCAQAIYEYLLK